LFFNFIIHEINSEMVVLNRREKIDIANADLAVNWMLQSATRTMVDERKRKSWRDVTKP
jgi:hypothetical protein